MTATIGDVFRAGSQRLRRRVPYDAALWIATDPTTGLPTAPTRTENVAHGDARGCAAFWEREFLSEDVNQFSDLARAATPVASLRAATRDRPARSVRYRELLRPLGYADELRAVLRAGDRPWGVVSLFRREGPFSTEEVRLAASFSRPLAEEIRLRAQERAAPGATREPGLLLFAPDGELISVNDAAVAWIDELAADFAPKHDFGVALPTIVLAALMRARAIAEQRERGVARARVRAATGQWLVCHASCLRDAAGELGSTALVIEPAKASEIAPIIVEAYELTAREQEITQLLARGAATAEIAGALYLSIHTVRDYIKAIFEKVGVSARGELVAKLFAEHYLPLHLDDVDAASS